MYELVGDVHMINSAQAPIWSGVSKREIEDTLKKYLPEEIHGVVAFLKAYNSGKFNTIYLEGPGDGEVYWNRFQLFSEFTKLRTKRRRNLKEVYLDEEVSEHNVVCDLLNEMARNNYTNVNRLKPIVNRVERKQKYLPAYVAEVLESLIADYEKRTVFQELFDILKKLANKNSSAERRLFAASSALRISLNVEREAKWINKILRNGDGLVFCGDSHIDSIATMLRRNGKDAKVLHRTEARESNIDIEMKNAKVDMWNHRTQMLHDTSFIEDLLR